MNTPVLYGQASSERRAEENTICRQIVKEVNNFGVTQRQTLMVIYLLASELENGEQMRSITKLVRELGGDDLFLIGTQEPDNETMGGNDGPSSQ